MFRPVRTRPLRLRGERGLGQRGGFLVTKQRRRRPVLRKVFQRVGLMQTLRKAYIKRHASGANQLAFSPDDGECSRARTTTGRGTVRREQGWILVPVQGS